MTVSAKLIAASITADSAQPPLITMELRYPRFIHAEFMTHRVFSRNASSSRAVPVAKMIQDVIDDPAMPVRWGANQPGMQDAGDHYALVSNWSDVAFITTSETEYENPESTEDGWNLKPEKAWQLAREQAVEAAKSFAAAGYHKQVVNRLLEPFAHITVIVTATDWTNFFDLRCHPAADPTMRALADAMRMAMPIWDADFELLSPREWHLPYVTAKDIMEQSRFHSVNADHRLRLISAARCARVSYLNHDGSEPDAEKDLGLANRLLSDRHMSPFEHQGTPDPMKSQAFLWGNLKGWVQSRQLFEQEYEI